MRSENKALTVSTGVVYLLKAGPHYKIGKTNNMSRRLTELKIQLPFPVQLVHKIHTENMSNVERIWHKQFANKRRNGEWFALTDSDVAQFKKQFRL